MSYSRENSAKKERQPCSSYEAPIVIPRGMWRHEHYRSQLYSDDEGEVENPFVSHLNFEHVEMEDGSYSGFYEYGRSYKIK